VNDNALTATRPSATGRWPNPAVTSATLLRLSRPELGPSFPRKSLRQRLFAPTSPAMITRDQWRAFIDHPVVEWSLFGIGVVLLLLSPVVGVLPGPGGIIVAGIGLSLVLKTSLWAKRYYVRFKRWQPKAGGWTDWALRRRSARRRKELRKRQQATALDEARPN
jgi:hypothetical protein